jgi:hypothetical protein
MLVAKADAWSEMGNILKLGRVRIQIAPNPFVDSAGFRQVLGLERAKLKSKAAAMACGFGSMPISPSSMLKRIWPVQPP